MNCQQVRNRILGLESPVDLAADVAAHVDECDACCAWHRLYSQMDQALVQLPIPATDGAGKAIVLDRVRAAKAAATPSTKSSANHKPIADRPMPIDLERDLPPKKYRPGAYVTKYWPAGLVAATLLVGVIAWLSLRNQNPNLPGPPPADPMLDSVVRLNVELAKTQTAAERVDVLTRLADELNQEMRDIARADATGDNMQALERMYRKVVLQGLIAQAKMIERSKREVVLRPVADRLAQAVQVASQTAKEVPEHSAVRLRNAADIARDGASEIHKLLKEASL